MSEDNNINLLAAIKNYLKLNYMPAKGSPGSQVFFMSTEALTTKLHALYPTPEITQQLVAEWMHELGFTFEDNGDMMMEWKMCKFD